MTAKTDFYHDMDNHLNELIYSRIQALYKLDDRNRLLEVNEPDTEQPTPRLYLMRTKSKIIWYVRYDVPDSMVSRLERLIEREVLTDDFSQPLQHHDEYIAILEEDAPIEKINSGPAYILPELSESEKTVLITENNTHLLEAHFAWTLEIFDFRSPVVVMVEDNTAVAASFSARKTDKVAEAGVYTMENYRKRGYAEAIVRDWSIALREQGIQPLYSTSWDNIASQSVARKLGAIQFATDFSFI